MKLLGFSFDKINVERLKGKAGDLKISSNIDIDDIKEVKADLLKGDEHPLQVNFVYTVKYEPELALVDLKGTIIISMDSKQVNEAIKEWKKKKMTEEFRVPIFNLILRKATIKAIELEDEMGLPIHMPMPVLGNQPDQPEEPQSKKK